MKMAKKLVAVLLAGVLALSVLTACSGGAGPLTEETVMDYLLDMGKAAGYRFKKDDVMTTAAKNVLTFIDDTASDSKYDGKTAAEIFKAVMTDKAAQKKLSKLVPQPKEEGYTCTVSCAMVESYNTSWFQQGQTAVVATSLLLNQRGLWYPEEGTETAPAGELVGVAEGTIKGQKCMIAVFKFDEESHEGGAMPDEKKDSSEVTTEPKVDVE